MQRFAKISVLALTIIMLMNSLALYAKKQQISNKVEVEFISIVKDTNFYYLDTIKMRVKRGSDYDKNDEDNQYLSVVLYGTDGSDGESSKIPYKVIGNIDLSDNHFIRWQDLEYVIGSSIYYENDSKLNLSKNINREDSCFIEINRQIKCIDTISIENGYLYAKTSNFYIKDSEFTLNNNKIIYPGVSFGFHATTEQEIKSDSLYLYLIDENNEIISGSRKIIKKQDECIYTNNVNFSVWYKHYKDADIKMIITDEEDDSGYYFIVNNNQITSDYGTGSFDIELGTSYNSNEKVLWLDEDLYLTFSYNNLDIDDCELQIISKNDLRILDTLDGLTDTFLLIPRGIFEDSVHKNITKNNQFKFRLVYKENLPDNEEPSSEELIIHETDWFEIGEKNVLRFDGIYIEDIRKNYNLKWTVSEYFDYENIEVVQLYLVGNDTMGILNSMTERSELRNKNEHYINDLHTNINYVKHRDHIEWDTDVKFIAKYKNNVVSESNYFRLFDRDSLLTRLQDSISDMVFENDTTIIVKIYGNDTSTVAIKEYTLEKNKYITIEKRIVKTDNLLIKLDNTDGNFSYLTPHPKYSENMKIFDMDGKYVSSGDYSFSVDTDGYYDKETTEKGEIKQIVNIDISRLENNKVYIALFHSIIDETTDGPFQYYVMFIKE